MNSERNWKPRHPGPMAVAVHEMGHAVAHWLLDERSPYPGPRVHEITVVATDRYLGIVVVRNCLDTIFMRMEDPFPKEFFPDAERVRRDAQRNARRDIIESLAGPIAEQRWAYRSHLGPSLEQGYLLRRILGWDAERAAAAGDFCDDTKIKLRLDWLAPANPLAELTRLWEETEEIVSSEWRGIVATARHLREVRTVDGEEMHQRWKMLRRAPLRSGRLGAPAIEASAY